MPAFFPMMRMTLVAPMFPEPCLRMSTPFERAMRRPKGTEPMRKARSGRSQDMGFGGVGKGLRRFSRVCGGRQFFFGLNVEREFFL